MKLDQFEFVYDSTHSYESNYAVWRQLNIEERKAWNDVPLDDAEARKIFEEMFPKTVDK